MANYTKQELGKLEVKRAFAESPRPAKAFPVCECGAPAEIEVNRWPRVAYFCAAHLAEAEAAINTATRGCAR